MKKYLPLLTLSKYCFTIKIKLLTDLLSTSDNNLVGHISLAKIWSGSRLVVFISSFVQGHSIEACLISSILLSRQSVQLGFWIICVGLS